MVNILPPIVTEGGRQWIVWEGRFKFPFPFNPEDGVFLLAAPPGGIGQANFPFMVQGDPGMPALIDLTPEVSWIEYSDPTPESLQWVEIQPATTTQSQKVRLRAVLRRGKPGADGSTIIKPGDYGTPVVGRVLAVNSAATGFELVPPRVSNRHWPTVSGVSEAGAGTTGSRTVAVVSIPVGQYPTAYQLSVSGTTVVTVAGSGDCRVDLVARLNSESGPVLGRGYGLGGASYALTLVDGPNPGALAGDITVAAGAASTVYLRAEKIAGADSFSTAGTRLLVKGCPL